MSHLGSPVGLSRWQRYGLVFFFVMIAAFGGLVEKRTAFLSRKMGDLDVYLRTAWAIRAGTDFYQVKDDLGWHYNYPPLLAIVMTPLADPPAGADRTGMLPFAASVAVWYLLSVLCIAFAVHWLAGALEKTSADPSVRNQPAGCRRWWALRLIPVLACLPPIGHSLMRGQVNPLVLILFCGMIAALVRGRSLLAGLCLAGAICIKVYPAFLILYPLWRRDARCLAGCALGLFLGLAALPVAVFGPARTWHYYQEYASVTLAPALGAGADESRARELIEITATDSQSLLAIFHNALNLDRTTRPRHPATAVRAAQFAAGGLLTLLTLLAASWRRKDSRTGAVLFPSALVVVMLLLSPVCHLHYFMFLVPLVMGLVEAAWQRHGAPRLGPGLWTLLAANLVANTLPNIPGFEVERDVGLATYATLLLWLAAIVVLWKQTYSAATLVEQPGVSGLAA